MSWYDISFSQSRHGSKGNGVLCIVQVEEQVMELGWLLGHLVYVRGLLPELFGALAEVQTEDNTVGATLDPLQCVLLELLSEEMENGSTRQQLKCATLHFNLASQQQSVPLSLTFSNTSISQKLTT